MKTTITKIVVLIFSFTLVLTSCRTESEDIIENNQEQNPNKDRILDGVANIMIKTITKDGSIDNVLDNASCLTVMLPVSITIGQKEITVNTVEDYKIVEDELEVQDNEFPINFLFPIKVILSNYSEVEVNNFNQLQNLINSCAETDDDIECIDFKYPITFASFNTVSEVLSKVTVNNDKEQFQFLSSISNNDIVEINFPISMIQADGTTIIINNITDLEKAISEAVNTCDEDDDNDFNDDDCNDCTIETLIEAFNSCKVGFTVDKSFDANNNSSSRLENVTFIFNEDRTLEVVDTARIIGRWSAQGTGNNIEFKMILPPTEDGDPDEEFIYRLSEIKMNEDGVFIDLKLEGGQLLLKCNPQDTPPSFIELLTSGLWGVALFEQNGQDDSITFEDYRFDFSLDKTLLSNNEVEQVSGEWDISTDENSFSLNFNSTEVPNSPLLNLSNNYTVKFTANKFIELETANIKLRFQKFIIVP